METIVQEVAEKCRPTYPKADSQPHFPCEFCHGLTRFFWGSRKRPPRMPEEKHIVCSRRMAAYARDKLSSD